MSSDTIIVQHMLTKLDDFVEASKGDGRGPKAVVYAMIFQTGAEITSKYDKDLGFTRSTYVFIYSPSSATSPRSDRSFLAPSHSVQYHHESMKKRKI